MANRDQPGLSAELGRLRNQIEFWRCTRGKQGPMPANLWTAAANLAQVEGPYVVSRALRINYATLKQKVAAASPAAAAVADGFVELAGAELLDPGPRATVIECSDETGARMVVRLAVGAEVDVARVVAAFRRPDGE